MKRNLVVVRYQTLNFFFPHVKSILPNEFTPLCVAWPKTIVGSVAVLTGIIMLWKYAPIDRAIDKILPKFNNTGEYSEDFFGEFGNVSPENNEEDTKPTYPFMQCKKDRECCNGMDICDLRVDEILYATSHNAMATLDDGFLFGTNHRFGLEGALEAGYRGINLDLCNCGGMHVFCHGHCYLGSRDVVDVFTAINAFLDNFPSEVLMIPIEINDSADQPIVFHEFYRQMEQVSGFTDKLYEHDDSSSWPTLRQSVESNKRVYMFHSKGPDCEGSIESCPPGMNSYPKYAIDTEWNFQDLEAIMNIHNSCALRNNIAITNQVFFGINSFVVPASQEISQELNSLKFARERINACSQLVGKDPNFIYADFWSEGDLPQLVQEHNIDLARRRLNRNIRGHA